MAKLAVGLAHGNEVPRQLVGASVLAYRALAAVDNAELRRESLREGEPLAESSIALTALNFYPIAIESCLLARDWREARRLSEHFAARFAAEPVPLVEFLVGRGRLLADLGEKGSSAPMVKALHRCRKLGQAWRLFLKLLDKAIGDEAS